MARGPAPADFDGGEQQVFRVVAYAKIFGEDPTTTWRKIKQGKIPVIETCDGVRITRKTIVQRLSGISASGQMDGN